MWIKIVHWHVWRLAMLFVQSTARWGLLATDCSATSPLLILILILFLSFSDLHRKAAITSYNRRIKHQRVPSHVFLVEPMLHSGSLSSSRGTWVIKQFGRPPCSSITSAWLQISALWSSGPQLLSNYSGSDSSATHPEPYIGKQTHHTQKFLNDCVGVASAKENESLAWGHQTPFASCAGSAGCSQTLNAPQTLSWWASPGCLVKPWHFLAHLVRNKQGEFGSIPQHSAAKSLLHALSWACAKGNTAFWVSFALN